MDSHFCENDKFVKTTLLTASSKPKMNKIKPYHIWLAFSLITLTVIGIVSLRLQFRGDERHIVETIKLFADNFKLDTIKD
ncbi:MAG: hypothetical protein IH619_02335, partial [Ignavibacterium sp.]|nr:hypothetical protein [Ignavibacterium sp.]